MYGNETQNVGLSATMAAEPKVWEEELEWVGKMQSERDRPRCKIDSVFRTLTPQCSQLMDVTGKIQDFVSFFSFYSTNPFFSHVRMSTVPQDGFLILFGQKQRNYCGRVIIQKSFDVRKARPENSCVGLRGVLLSQWVSREEKNVRQNCFQLAWLWKKWNCVMWIFVDVEVLFFKFPSQPKMSNRKKQGIAHLVLYKSFGRLCIPLGNQLKRPMLR